MPDSGDGARRGFSGARVVVGVSGGIAAYKAAELVSTLMQAGSAVDVLLTRGGAKFVTPMTFMGLTRRPVMTDAFDGWSGGGAGHVTLARDAEAVIVAPCSANTISRLAHGRVEDMLGAVVLATEAPVIIAPAMEHHMWHHPATQDNIRLLQERGVIVVEPEAGYLASGARGDGRLASLPALVGTLRRVLGRDGGLRGTRVVVTAGGTREPLDPVRFLGNGSTGKMGIALAEAAIDLGADVELIATASVADVPGAMSVTRVESARDLAAAVAAVTVHADVLIMAAAVADFRPQAYSPVKIKKTPGASELTLDLVRNPDILADAHGEGLIKVGFAAETHDLLDNARAKLSAKGLAMIVANDVEATIGHDHSEATLLFADGPDQALPMLSKADVAARIMDHVTRLVSERDARA